MKPVNIDMDLNNMKNSWFVKQGSLQWHEIWKKMRVTGSTLGKAIGLNTLAAQKLHHSIFVCNKPPPETPPDILEKLQHGSKYEVHGLATVVGGFIAALQPPCHSLV